MAKILIIDDDISHNLLNKMLMESIGLNNVETRLSGAEALVYLDQCDKNNTFPDIIFVDLNMVGMSGLTFLQQYESRFGKYVGTQRVIVLTNSILDSEREETLTYKSVKDYWIKPLTKFKLLELKEKVMR